MATPAAVTNRPQHLSDITQQRFISRLTVLCSRQQSLCCWSTGGQLSITSDLETQVPLALPDPEGWIVCLRAEEKA